MTIRKIEQKDNKALAVVLRSVLTEIGANSEGFAFADPQLDTMFEHYGAAKSVYYVVENDKGEIVGGAGIGALAGVADTMELQKMYFLPEARGKGLAQKLLKKLLEDGSGFGYKKCYIETVDNLSAALKLYRKNGFEHLTGSYGNTGHFGCNVFMLKYLD